MRACLADTGGVDVSLCGVEAQHSVVPGEAAVLQHAPAPVLLLPHQRLVGHPQHAPRQQPIPVLHYVVVVLYRRRNLCAQSIVHRDKVRLSSASP